MLNQNEPFQPTYDTIIGYVDILDEMYLDLYFAIHSFPEGAGSDWGNIFQCGSENERRYPAIYIDSDTGLFVTIQDGVDAVIEGEWLYNVLALHETYHVQIEFTQNRFTVSVNDQILYDADKSTHTLYRSVPCYASFPAHSTADVTIFNITMWSTSTLFPTASPTTTEPTPNPTTDSGLVPTVSTCWGSTCTLDDHEIRCWGRYTVHSVLFSCFM